MRDKLVELLSVTNLEFDDIVTLANFLIRKGVTIPVRCGECIHRVKGTYAKCSGRSADEFCSDGYRRFHV